MGLKGQIDDRLGWRVGGVGVGLGLGVGLGIEAFLGIEGSGA